MHSNIHKRLETLEQQASTPADPRSLLVFDHDLEQWDGRYSWAAVAAALTVRAKAYTEPEDWQEERQAKPWGITR